MIRKQPFWAGVFCLLVAYLTLFHQLGLLPFFGSDEPRYAQIAKEMYQQENFITPTLEGRPWLEKPPLLFWMLMGSFSQLGPSEWSARLPNALIAFIMAIGIGTFAGTYRGIRCGFLTFLVLTTSLMYVGYARAASTDLPLTTAFALSTLSGFLALNRHSYLWALVSGTALGLTVLVKGFVAAPLVFVILLLYSVITGKSVPLGPTLLGSAAAILVPTPWLWQVWIQNKENFLITFVVNQHLARVATDLHHHSQPFWYYLPVLLGGFYPWVLFLPAAARDVLRKRYWINSGKLDLEVLLWLWATIPFLFFSVSTGKLAGYILPIFPAISLLVALRWDSSLEDDEFDTWMLNGLRLFPFFALILAGGAVIGFSIVFKVPQVGVLLAAVPLGAIPVIRWATSRSLAAVFLTLTGFTTLGLALIHTHAAPVVGKFQSTRQLCLDALPYISPEQPMVFFRFHHFTSYYYAHGEVKASPLHNPAALTKYITDKPQDTYIIMTAQHGWSELDQLQDSTLLSRAGNFYLVQLRNTPELAEGLKELDRKHREALDQNG